MYMCNIYNFILFFLTAGVASLQVNVPVSLWHVMSVLGLKTAAILMVPWAKFHKRPLQLDSFETLRSLAGKSLMGDLLLSRVKRSLVEGHSVSWAALDYTCGSAPNYRHKCLGFEGSSFRNLSAVHLKGP